jgi:PAS domain S-box-containing protein
MLRIKRAADESPDMIFQLMCVPGGVAHFPYVSEAVRTLYGSTPQDAQASADAVFARVLDADRVALLQARDAAAAAGQVWRACARVHTRDGGMAWHEFSASPRQLANGVTLWHGHVANVTQRRAMEQAAADREAARQASRAKSDFLARVSHELRTPLNGILGFAHLLATQDSDNLRDEQRRRLAVVQTAGQGLLHLINDVLDITSIEMGQLSLHLMAQPLDAAIDQALAVAEPQALAAGVTLLRPPPSGLQVQADPRRLQQVLGNLLSNAIKYNRPGGRVVLHAGADEAGRKEGDPVAAALAAADGGPGVGPGAGATAAAGRVRVAVQDTGPGMDAAQVARLFEPFNRLGAERAGVEGTGLGLAITRQLVQHMGGEIAVQSVPGHGSCFTVWLPIGGPPAPADVADAPGRPAGAAPVPWQGPVHHTPHAAGPQHTAPHTGQHTAQSTAQHRAHRAAQQAHVLYVEDNPVNAMLMEAIVGLRPGLRLQVCADVAQGLAAAQADPPALLLLDMQLPDGDGCSLLRRLRLQPALAAVPAVAVSAAASSHDLQQAREAGFDAYWTKPLAVDEVLAALDTLLGPSPA